MNKLTVTLDYLSPVDNEPIRTNVILSNIPKKVMDLIGEVTILKEQGETIPTDKSEEATFWLHDLVTQSRELCHLQYERCHWKIGIFEGESGFLEVKI